MVSRPKSSISKAAKHPALHFITFVLGEIMHFGLRDLDQDVD